MPEVWRLLELAKPEDPVWNMALDASLLDASPDAAPVLRFYQWSRPSLSIGYFQNVEKTVRAYDCEAKNWRVVRRPTGGGLVRHGQDLTMSFAVFENHPRLAGRVSDSYRAVHDVIREALLPLFPGLAFAACDTPLKARSERLCFEEPVACDLEVGGKKIVGSSQRRKNGRLLHQTSIQLTADAADMARRIAAQFEKTWNLRAAASVLTAVEVQSAERLKRETESSPEWSFVPSGRTVSSRPIFS